MMTNPKSEILNPKQIIISQMTIPRKNNYDLEERTFKFAQRISRYVNNLPKIVSNIEYGKQLVRSAGSVGANYIEANESLSKKDFALRIKISKKEAEETRFWIRLTEPREEFLKEKEALIAESIELMKIFGAILEKTN